MSKDKKNAKALLATFGVGTWQARLVSEVAGTTRDVLDAAITAWRDHALVLNTWTT